MPITISGSIFNFNISGYIPPTWSGTDTYSFGVFNPDIYQLYSDQYSVFAATSAGLSIFDLTSETFIAYIVYDGGFSTIAGNSDRIYVGTTNSGIKYADKTCISGSLTTPVDVETCLVDLYEPYITSSGIKYMHTNNNHLAACTNSGIDYFRFNINPYIHSKTTVAGAQKCFVTESSTYYTISGTNPTTSGMEYSLNRIDTHLADWVVPTKIYTTGSGIFGEGLKLTDMYITEGTAEYGGNTIFCTTSSGIYVIDEDTQHYAIYYTE